MSGPSLRAPSRARRLAAVAVTGALAAVGACSTENADSAYDEPGAPAADQRPSVVLVVVDDLGWADVSSDLATGGHGNDLIETPAFDRLAETGTVFDNAYAAPTCSPSRTALLTGEYAPREDNNVFMVGGIDRGDRDSPLRGPEQGRGDGRLVLPAEATTVAETVRDAGYATGYAGKFHVTRWPRQIVEQHGFEENYGGSQAGAIMNYHALGERFDFTVWETLDPWADDYTQAYVDERVAPYSTGTDPAAEDALVGTPKHVTDALTDATIEHIDANADRPTFTVLGHYGVHTPVDAPQARADLLAKYAAKQDAGEAGDSPATPAYAAIAEGVDQSIARIVDHLETTADPRNPGHVLADNTIVVVTSDNGGRTDVGADNGPLRGQKGELDEGGVRVPWVVWSGDEDLVRREAVVSSPVSLLDVYPTMTELADTAAPDGVTLDGTSLVETLRTGERAETPYFAHLPGYLQGGARDQTPESFVRDRRWKLRYTYADRRFRLYDLESDPGETEDLAARQPWRVEALGRTLIDWLDEVDAPLATLAPGQAPVTFEVRGSTYADGRITRQPRARVVTVQPGQEMPLVLPAR